MRGHPITRKCFQKILTKQFSVFYCCRFVFTLKGSLISFSFFLLSGDDGPARFERPVLNRLPGGSSDTFRMESHFNPLQSGVINLHIISGCAPFKIINYQSLYNFVLKHVG